MYLPYMMQERRANFAPRPTLRDVPPRSERIICGAGKFHRKRFCQEAIAGPQIAERNLAE